MWEGERPTPADLVRQFKDPVQVAMMMARVEVETEAFYLADH